MSTVLSLPSRLSIRLRAFWRDQRGGAAAFIAAATIPLLAFGGLALDASRAYLVRSHLGAALDSAALAGGKVLNGTVPEIQADVEKYFQANFPDGVYGANVELPTITISEDAEVITLTADATVGTTMMRVLGFDQLAVTAETEVTRDVRGLELVLVMDNTGSMKGSKINTMKSAAQDLINILYGERETVDNFWVGLVPYTATVNIGTDNLDWLDNYDSALYDQDTYDPEVASWKGCVEARDTPLDQDDTTPAGNEWPAFYWTSTDGVYVPDGGDNDWNSGNVNETEGTAATSNNGLGPNLGCPPAITPLRAEKSVISAAIGDMNSWHRGGTFSNLGLAWGWRVISPQWRGLWTESSDPGTLPLDYDAELMDKVVIILTDGQNQWYDWPGNGSTDGLPNNPDADYTGYGRPSEGRLGSTNKNDAPGIIAVRFSATCQAMKAEGIVMYTITFGLSGNQSLKNLYQSCASSPDKYFDSPSTSQLQDVFKKIGNQLANLRLSK